MSGEPAALRGSRFSSRRVVEKGFWPLKVALVAAVAPALGNSVEGPGRGDCFACVRAPLVFGRACMAF